MIPQQEERTSQQLLGSTVFPLKFCATRLVEDAKVAQRAIEILPNIEWYIAHVLKETKNKYPTSASFTTVQKATKDPLLLAKLQVFVYSAKVLKPFLLKHQTDAPKMMLLGEDLQEYMPETDAEFCEEVHPEIQQTQHTKLLIWMYLIPRITDLLQILIQDLPQKQYS